MNKKLVINIAENFNFDQTNVFKSAYDNLGDDVDHIVLDMRNTNAIDSSALGMMLNMHRFLSGKMIKIEIVNCNDRINKIFQISGFNKKFIIS